MFNRSASGDHNRNKIRFRTNGKSGRPWNRVSDVRRVKDGRRNIRFTIIQQIHIG